MKRKWEDEQEKRSTQEVYTDFEVPLHRNFERNIELGKYQESRKSKITRTNRVLNYFNELSLAEQRDFISQIKNHITI